MITGTLSITIVILVILIFRSSCSGKFITEPRNIFHGRKLHFVSYGNDKFKKSRERITKNALDTKWFYSVKVYTPDDVPEHLKNMHPLTKEKRGDGYWYWKIYIILRELLKSEPGSYVIWNDAGCKINEKNDDRLLDYLQLIDDSPYDNLAFPIKHKENIWTTKEIFNAFGLGVNSKEGNSDQYTSSVMIYKNTPHSRRILETAFNVFLNDPLLISDHYGSYPQTKEFIENRHDQSLLSLVRKIYGSVVVMDNYDDSNELRDYKISPFMPLRIRG